MCLAIPGKILSIQGEDFARVARVNLGGIIKEVSLACLPERKRIITCWFMSEVPSGLVGEAEAGPTWNTLKSMDELEELDPTKGETQT
jgi:hydrogenase expression/formation protein HypC